MSEDRSEVIDELSILERSESPTSKPALRVEFQIGPDQELCSNTTTTSSGGGTMQQSHQELVSIAEHPTDPSQSSSSHSMGESTFQLHVVTSAPVPIPGSSSSSRAGPPFAIQTSPVYSSPQSFMIRQSASAPALPCYFCGSSPKVCHTASTQTTAQSAMMDHRQQAAADSEDSDSGDESDDDTIEEVPLYLPGNGNNRWRSRSESDEAGSRTRCHPLPDLLEFRNRSHSEPADIRPEIEVGRELRRISDEFHLSYQECRVTRRRSTSQIEKPSFFWELVGTIRRRASFTRGSSV